MVINGEPVNKTLYTMYSVANDLMLSNPTDSIAKGKRNATLTTNFRYYVEKPCHTLKFLLYYALISNYFLRVCYYMQGSFSCTYLL